MSSARRITGDGYQNFAADVGLGASNLASGGSYGFTPITRNHVLLEWCYRGSWIARKTVDCPADDMTRQGIRITDDMPPDRIERITNFWLRKQLWVRLNSTLKWARLYGGCLAVIVIEGQKFSEPLRVNTVGRGSFKGLIVLDRWMVTPDFSDLISDPGSPDYGNPKYYNVVADARTLPQMKIHHSRCIRIDGVELPYWQKTAENGWSLSVLEPMWDRLLAFDSVTQGAAQLVFRAYVRTIKLPKLREAIASGGKAYRNVLKNIAAIRLMQSNEGLTLLDAEDSLETNQYAFGGLADMMSQFGMQLSGASDVPLTRMFGQSPGGLSSTGESDLENYRDGLKSQQVVRLTEPVQTLLELTHRSEFGEPLPGEFGWEFAPLGQLSDEKKAGITTQVTAAVVQAHEAQLITTLCAARELRQLSRTTGVFSNLTDADLAEIEANPPGAAEGLGDPPGAAEVLEDEPGPPSPETDDAAVPDHRGAVAEAAARSRAPVDRSGEVAAAANRSRVDKFVPEKIGTARESVRETVRESRTEAVAALADRSARDRVAVIAKTRTARQTFSRTAAESSSGAEEPFRLGTRTRDGYPVVEFRGLSIVVETEKGARRYGNGWSVLMPARYGYVQGTSSSEGPQEQFDAFVGGDLESPTVYLIEQVHPATKRYDEGKLMIGFRTRAEAVDCYVSAFSDGRGASRIGKVVEMRAEELPRFLKFWKFGSPPPKVSQVRDAGKFEKTEVKYHLTAGADRCDACEHFVAGGSCRLVAGKIAPNGWCDRFERKPGAGDALAV